jgi:uncharacterized protein (TIGR03437 family)
MKFRVIVCACLLGWCLGVNPAGRFAFHTAAEPAPTTAATRLHQSYSRFPLRFEVNQGQSAPEIQFIARGHGYALALTGTEAVLQKNGARFRLQWLGANARAQSAPAGLLPGRSHYFRGKTPQQWRTDMIGYARVEYAEIYPGIDLVWYGNQQHLEHDFIVAPGANPKQIKLAFPGLSQVTLSTEGDVVLRDAAAELRLLKPVAYQERGGQRQAVSCEYHLDEKQQLGFVVGAYDQTQPLVLDPVLIHSNVFGGENGEEGLAVAVDQAGNTYLAGTAQSPNLPGLITLPHKGGTDAFVMKLNRSGTEVLFTAYLGGADENHTDEARGVAVDAAGNVFVAGRTNADDFPRTAGTYRGQYDAFLTKLSPNGATILSSLLLGGSGNDEAYGLALDSSGNAYLAGRTDSGDLPANGWQPARQGELVYKSINGGLAWNGLSRGLSGSEVNKLALDPANANILFAATDAGIFKSTNGGTQWQPKATFKGIALQDFNPSRVLSVAVSPANSQTIFAGAEGGLYRSLDGGESWLKMLESTGYGFVFDPRDAEKVFAATSAGAHRTPNNGATWLLFGFIFPPARFYPRGYDIALARPQPQGAPTLFVASNQGLARLTNVNDDTLSGWTRVLNVEASAVAVDPQAPDTVYAGAILPSGAIYKSTDGGNTWAARNTGLTLPNTASGALPRITTLVVDPVNSDIVYAGTNTGGIFKSTNGGLNWSAINTGLNSLSTQTVALERTTPATLYAGQRTGADAFVAKINMAGTSLGYLTYLGGTDEDTARGIAVDASGNAYVTGTTASRNFPTQMPRQAALAGQTDAFVTKLNATGTALLYSTYLGGAGIDEAYGIAINTTGNAFVAGLTASADFPVAAPLQATRRSGKDAFVSKLSVSGTALDYSTYLGGSHDDRANGIAVDNRDQAYVTGQTFSSDFPRKDALRSTGIEYEGFVTQLGATGSLGYSTYLGGSSFDFAYAIAVDAVGNAYVAGGTFSGDFPTGRYSYRGSVDAFLVKLGTEVDLAVTQSTVRNPVQVNNRLALTFTLNNRGPSPATGLTLTDSLPTGVNFVSATPSQGSCAVTSGTLTCNFGTLAAQATATLTLHLTPNVTGTVSNTVRIASNEPEGNPADNQATLSIVISNLPSIAGRITSGGASASGVELRLSGTQTATQTTDANGNFQFANLALNGNYTLTPVSRLYSFEPPSRSFNNLTMDQTGDFVATTCTYALSATNQSFGPNGGSGNFTVTATPRCAWTASSTAPWLTVTSGADGNGNGTVSFSVAPTTVARNARITLAGLSFAVFQSFNECAAPRFGTTVYGLDTTTYGVVAADLTADGNDDLVIDGRLFIGDGRGHFATPLSLPMGALNPAVADFNSDGKLDLAFLSSTVTRTQVNVSLNKGGGAFETPLKFDLPSKSPQEQLFSIGSIYIAELNRDGKPDLVISTQSLPVGLSDYVYGVLPLLNQGDRQFTATAPSSTGRYKLIGVADFNNDGNSDLATAQDFYLDSDLRIFPGDANGNFGAPLSSPTFGAAISGSFADANGDGNLDALLVTRSDGTLNTRHNVVVMLGDGVGRFSPYEQKEINLDAYFPFARDFNGDAKLDVLLRQPDKFVVLLGDGTGKLAAPLELPFSLDFFTGASTALGDFNRDGKPDLVQTNYDRRSFSVHLNRCAVGPVIAGRVLDGSGYFLANSLSGTTIKLTNAATPSAALTIQTDSGGNYEFGGLTEGGNYTVTPERSGVTFTPAQRNFPALNTDQTANFSGIRQAVLVSAASYQSGPVAPDSIAAVFGAELTGNTATATSLPLPFVLGSTLARLQTVNNLSYSIRLFFVSPNQLNILVPANLPQGAYTLVVQGSQGNTISLGTTQIESVAPGLFTANATGQGLAAALVLRIRRDGMQVFEPVARYESTQNRFVAIPIEVSNPDEQVFLLLFGTGLRNRAPNSLITAKIAGTDTDILFAGAQGDLAGLDQINLRLPPSLAGRGEAEIQLGIAGKIANLVKLVFK